MNTIYGKLGGASAVDTTDRDLLAQALDALDAILKTLIASNEQGVITDTIWFSDHETLFDHIASETEALRERLAQPEQEKNA